MTVLAVGRLGKGIASTFDQSLIARTLETVANRILEIAGQRSHLAHRPLVDLMCRHLHLAPMRLGPYVVWPNNRPIAVHAKFWMVDDRVFYIGSENFYRSNLEEFGYVVEDPTASAYARADLWNQAWQWSQQAAISGSEAHTCVFKAQDVQKTAKYGRK